MKKIYNLNLIERNDVVENTIGLIFTKPSDYNFKIGQYTFRTLVKTTYHFFTFISIV